MLGVFVAVFAMTGTTALANDNNNNNRIGKGPADGVPCQGLYNAGVGAVPATRPTGGRTYGTPGYWHVFENDEERCHQREFLGEE